jgi:hypothetical protein
MVPGLFIVRVAPFRRPLGTFSSSALSTPRHRVGTAKYRVYLLFSPEDHVDGGFLLRSSAPLSQLVFNNEGGFRYMAGSITCNMTGMVASLQLCNDDTME